MFGVSTYGLLHFRQKNPKFSENSAIPCPRVPIGPITPQQPCSDDLGGVFCPNSWDQWIRKAAQRGAVVFHGPIASGLKIFLAATIAGVLTPRTPRSLH